MLVLTRTDIEQVLDADAVLTAVEAAHAALASGDAAQARRDNLPVPGSDRLLVPMIAASGPAGAAGLKLLVDSPSNPAAGLPRQQSTILITDLATGSCEALLDGAAITGVRTAAASAVATRHLARADATSLGLIGGGNQAWAHLHAMRAVRTIETVVVWSRNSDRAAAFVKRCRSVGIDALAVATPRAVVDNADIVCTLTPALDPVVEGAWLRPGQHLNVVGAPPRPQHREVDIETLRRSRIVVDDREVALAESGAILAALEAGVLDIKDLDADLGEVISGLVAGRSNDEQITLYNSVGVGIQDIVAARLVIDLARAKGLGTEIDLSA